MVDKKLAKKLADSLVPPVLEGPIIAGITEPPVDETQRIPPGLLGPDPTESAESPFPGDIPPMEDRDGTDHRGLELKSTNPKDAIGIKKVAFHLLPGPALVWQSLAHKNGAIKYGPYNWRREGVSASVYVGAALRHIHAWFDGQDYDKDSGLPALAHAMACLNIIADALACGLLVDDRPPAAPTAQMLEEFKDRRGNDAKA